MKSFNCKGCLNPVMSAGRTSVDIGASGRWRKLIRMVDEQDGCEWMNVSSGTGSPG